MTGGAGEDFVNVLVVTRICFVPGARSLVAQPERSALRLRWRRPHHGRSELATTRLVSAWTGARSAGLEWGKGRAAGGEARLLAAVDGGDGHGPSCFIGVGTVTMCVLGATVAGADARRWWWGWGAVGWLRRVGAWWGAAAVKGANGGSAVGLWRCVHGERRRWRGRTLVVVADGGWWRRCVGAW